MKQPAVTLAIPAYNESERLEKTVHTLINQSMTDFELLLADNCSTDDTMEVMKRLQKQDSRIRILPSNKNHGAVWNVGRLLTEARGTFFAWVGAHDYYHPEWLATLVDAISEDDHIVSVYPYCYRMLSDFSLFDISKFRIDTRGMKPKERIEAICSASAAGDRIYGLHRTEAAKKCPVTICIRWDTLFLARLGFYGDMCAVDDTLRYRYYEQPPIKSDDYMKYIIDRQYRVIYPNGEPFNWMHWMPHYYHLAQLVRDTFKNYRTNGLQGVILTLHACRAYHKRNAKNIPPDWTACKERIRKALNKGGNK